MGWSSTAQGNSMYLLPPLDPGRQNNLHLSADVSLEICGVFLWQPTASEAHHLHPEDAVSRRQSRAENGAATLLFHVEASEPFAREMLIDCSRSQTSCVCLWVKWRTNCKSLMMCLFWEADRDFSFVIFETPEPVCEPGLLVFLVHCSDSYSKHFYCSHPHV